MRRDSVSAPALPPVDPRIAERDACGVGVIAKINGQSTHSIVRSGLEILGRLAHRGASSWDPQSSDGAGILMQLPHLFFAKHFPHLPARGRYAVAVLFCPREASLQAQGLALFQDSLQRLGLSVLGTRVVPVNSAVLGPLARAEEPEILHWLVHLPTAKADQGPDLCLVARLLWEKSLSEVLGSESQQRFHLASFAADTIVYKALCLGAEIGAYYPELLAPQMRSAFAVVHQRFSTNTLAAWRLAQPLQQIAHNGEINTLRANLNALSARQAELTKTLPGFNGEAYSAIPAASDSAAFDRMLSCLRLSGRSLVQSMSMMMPPAWEKLSGLSKEVAAYYEYQSHLMEPWDGPALIAFAQGQLVGAALDRHGLRPCRYVLTQDGRLILASEMGVLPVPPAQILQQGSLGPGEMLAVDLGGKTLRKNSELQSDLAATAPYRHWLEAGLKRLKIDASDPMARIPVYSPDKLVTAQGVFGYDNEELRLILSPLGRDGKEAVGSMGNDTPLAILRTKPQRLSAYFHQCFAQVTNPPIDSLRESLVCSLATILGGESSFLSSGPEHANALRLEDPLLDALSFAALNDQSKTGLSRALLDGVLAPGMTDGAALSAGLSDLIDVAVAAVTAGSRLLILSDQEASPQRVPMPALLALGAVHQGLLRAGLRRRCSIVLRTSELRDAHDLALALAFGADAIFPELAIASAAALAPQTSALSWAQNYLQGLSAGIQKIMSKLGITTIQSYRGGQTFEVIGLSPEVMQLCFTSTPSVLGGIGFAELAADVLSWHQAAYSVALPVGSRERGLYAWRSDGERHRQGPQMILDLQKAIEINSQEAFRTFMATAEGSAAAPMYLRDLLQISPLGAPVPLSEVEAAAAIVKRMATGAMSLGSLSEPAHETIAIAMNRMGAKSNSGEGGEDPGRYQPRADGENARSAIKQVASGRFGVTTEYLVEAAELQIKIAQGAKPGEGGQLPGHKVSATIARLRHTSPGVSLISPPPHHDIYSIEDLAQLIYDLGEVNPTARISVKLVATHGVGTIAAGVAKAQATGITIAGFDGGTGASPLTSTYHAGIPWELGLAETQQRLVTERLRSRVVVQVDGGLRTPRDLLIATLLGADEWGIGTGALLAIGCIMMRKCHLNTCPVGIATQDPQLVARFAGKPEQLIRYLFMLAEELRVLMASLGARSIGELVGRSDLLARAALEPDSRAATLDLSPLLQKPLMSLAATAAASKVPSWDELVLIPAAQPALAGESQVRLSATISNTQRSIGTRLSGEIIRRCGAPGLPAASIVVELSGSAGQSFMAFAVQGILAVLTGEANDYCGKGLAGAVVAVRPAANSSFHAEDAVLCGNVALYGATAGQLFINGRAGERFAVRNSGAEAVVEGIGYHGGEYMTKGVLVVLGSIGANFGAGMTGGCAYLYDPHRQAAAQLNTEYVGHSVLHSADLPVLKRLLQAHILHTQSPLAQTLVAQLEHANPSFIRVVPLEQSAVKTTSVSRASLPSARKRIDISPAIEASRG